MNKMTSSTVYSWLSLAVKKAYDALWQSINCSKHHHLHSTYSLVYDHVTITVSMRGWVWVILVFGKRARTHIVGNWSTHDSWFLIIRLWIYVHLCCCLATKTWRLLECHMHFPFKATFQQTSSDPALSICLKITRLYSQHVTNQVWSTTIIVQEIVTVEYFTTILRLFPNQFIFSTCNTFSITIW